MFQGFDEEDLSSEGESFPSSKVGASTKRPQNKLKKGNSD